MRGADLTGDSDDPAATGWRALHREVELTVVLDVLAGLGEVILIGKADLLGHSHGDILVVVGVVYLCNGGIADDKLTRIDASFVVEGLRLAID